MVILFFAGHGILDETMDYYLGTYNVDFTNPKLGGMPYEQFEALTEGIPARNKLVLLDACHSGELDKEDMYLTEASKKLNDQVSFRGFKQVESKSSQLGLTNSFELMNELFNLF